MSAPDYRNCLSLLVDWLVSVVGTSNLTAKLVGLLMIALLLAAAPVNAEDGEEGEGEPQGQPEESTSCPPIVIQTWAPFVFVYPDCL